MNCCLYRDMVERLVSLEREDGTPSKKELLRRRKMVQDVRLQSSGGLFSAQNVQAKAREGEGRECLNFCRYGARKPLLLQIQTCRPSSLHRNLIPVQYMDPRKRTPWSLPTAFHSLCIMLPSIS